MDTVVIYPGRFHPFHKGHKSVYDTLVKRFGKDRVYIATSNKIDPPKSPFTFDEKRAMMALTGVDPSRVVQTKNPYQATEITDNFDPQNTTALFAVSDKDMAEDPRFSFKPKKDGSPSYYQPAQKDMRPMSEHGYIITVPTLQFNVLGKPMRSASEFRANSAVADSETQKAMITDLFGRYDPKIHNTMTQKIVEQLLRADAILDKLIEMGADDCYILEACIRVDALVESINMKQRKQTLYQAIMEGGHTLPENEIVREADYSTWDHPEAADYSEFLEKTFGEPDEATDEQTVWHNIDGFKRVVVRDEYILHGSPAPHYDFVYSYVDLEVPEELSDELAKCSGSILIDHLKNEVGARCGSLTANAVTLNFVLDVVAGRTEPSKEEYEDRILSMKDMFKRGMKFSLEWWPDEAGDADPENPYYAESVREEITDFNKQDPMNSVIAIRGIGTMSISSALKEVSEMAANVSNLAKVKDAKGIQDNFDRYMGLLNAYNTSIQEAYSELAQQRKRGGTASRGIDKDISEVMDQDRLNKFLGKKHDDDEDYKDDLMPITIGGGRKKKGSRPPLDFDPFGDLDEHCGDPMADDHKPMRVLLMKLYDKEMQCQPGSPEHFEVMQMINGCRKNIGLSESGILYRAGVKKYGKKGMTAIQSAAGKGASAEEIGKIKDRHNKKKTEGFMDNVKGAVTKVADKVTSDYKRRKKLFGKGKTA